MLARHARGPWFDSTKTHQPSLAQWQSARPITERPRIVPVRKDHFATRMMLPPGRAPAGSAPARLTMDT